MTIEIWRWVQKQDMGPSSRYAFSMAYDSNSKGTILFGGAETEYKNDTWEWDGNEWIQVADTGPPNRAFHSMIYDSSEKEILIFGGIGTASTLLSDTWKMKNNIWAKAQDMGPGPVALADMIYTGKRAVLFGGYDGTVTNLDTWDWKGLLWAQRQNMGPPSRAWHSMAYDSDRNRTVLFGGVNETNIEDSSAKVQNFILGLWGVRLLSLSLVLF